MVNTRNSTGSLPPPKLKSLAEDQSEDEVVHVMDESDGDKDSPRRKRAKKSRDSKQQTAEKDTGQSKATSSVAVVDADEDRHDTLKKPSRMNALITAALSKNETMAAKPIAKKSVRKDRLKKGDLGKLEKIMDLSVEVFFEIASHLTPNDLLNLSRTSRSLRAFLMSKSSRTVWVASLNSIGFPPCPSDMSEPQYANLFFEKECNICGNPRAGKNTYHLRVRLCDVCATRNIRRGASLLKEKLRPAKARRNYEILSLLPWSTFDPSDANWRRKARTDAKHHYFIIYDFLETFDAYMKTKPDSEERKAFVEKRHQLLEEIAKNIQDVETWHEEQRNLSSDSRQALTIKRQEQIVDKLVAIGYPRDEINSMSTLLKYWPYDRRAAWKGILYQPKELTDRSWKIIRPKLESLIANKRDYEEKELDVNRERRIQDAWRLYREHVWDRGLHKEDGVPLCFNDLLEVQLLKDLIEEHLRETEITRARWNVFEANLPKLQEDHSRRVERDCLNALLTAKDEVRPLGVPGPSGVATDRDFDTSILRNAYTFFDYERSLFSFEKVLSRRRERMLDCGYGCRAWQADLVSADPLIIQAAKALLSSLDLPDDTTMKHVVSLGEIFVCQQCDPIFRRKMSWECLVYHLHTEIRDYRAARSSPSAVDVPLLETHKLTSDVGPLAVIDPDFSEPSTALFTRRAYDETAPWMLDRFYCNLCKCFGKVVSYKYREQFEAHVRTLHGTDSNVAALEPVNNVTVFLITESD